jgi:hypothetical protein
MAQGDKVWKSTEAQSKGFKKQEPLPDGVYEMKLHTKKLSVEKGKESGKFYIKGLRLEALNSAEDGSTQNRSVFQSLYMAGENPNKSDQLKGLLDAIGTELEAEFLQDTDAKGVSYEYLDPHKVIDFLKQYDGYVIKANTKIDKGNAEYGPQAKVRYFIKPD